MHAGSGSAVEIENQMRDACGGKMLVCFYFQTFSGMPVPAGIERPVHELEDMKRFRLEISNYECPESGFNNKLRFLTL